MNWSLTTMSSYWKIVFPQNKGCMNENWTKEYVIWYSHRFFWSLIRNIFFSEVSENKFCFVIFSHYSLKTDFLIKTIWTIVIHRHNIDWSYYDSSLIFDILEQFYSLTTLVHIKIMILLKTLYISCWRYWESCLR